MTAAAAPPSMFAVFRKPDFTLLWFAQSSPRIGSSLTDLAAGISICQPDQFRARGWG